MNQEQNNFNTQGNNVMSNNKLLNNQEMNNNHFQNINQSIYTNQNNLNYQQTISQYNTSASNKINNNLNNKNRSKTLPIIIVVAIVIISIVGIMIYKNVDNSTDGNKIEKLNVDLEKYDLECENDSVCEEVKGKIIQIVSYDGNVNGNSYETLVLTSNGDVYLYDSLYKEMIKTKGSSKLTKIDSIFYSGLNYSNPLLRSGGEYYSIDRDSTIQKIELVSENISKIIKMSTNMILALNDDNFLTIYLSCSDYKSKVDSDVCPNDDEWIELAPSPGSFIDQKIKYVNSTLLVTENDELYNIPFMWEMDFDNFTYTERVITEDNVLIRDFKDIWYWDNGSSSVSGYTLVQTSDGNLHYNKGSFVSNDYKFDTTIAFSEEVQNAFVDSDVLIVGKNNVYYVTFDYNDEPDMINLDSLSKYKNEIRGMYTTSGIVYVLLSDGNLYKVYED